MDWEPRDRHPQGPPPLPTHGPTGGSGLSDWAPGKELGGSRDLSGLAVIQMGLVRPPDHGRGPGAISGALWVLKHQAFPDLCPHTSGALPTAAPRFAPRFSPGPQASPPGWGHHTFQQRGWGGAKARSLAAFPVPSQTFSRFLQQPREVARTYLILSIILKLKTSSSEMSHVLSPGLPQFTFHHAKLAASQGRTWPRVFQVFVPGPATP